MKSGYCAIMWNRRDRGTSEMNHHHHTKGQSSSKEGDVVYTVGLEGSSIMSSFRKTKTINFNKYCSQLDQLKAALDEKHPESVNRKHIIFHQDNAKPHVF